MQFTHLALLTAFALAGHSAHRAECRCPAFTAGSPVLVVTAHGGADALAVCGYLDGKHGSTIRASEFDVVRCRDGEQLLEFDATETADFQVVGDDLRVTRVGKWPVGARWEWAYVPIASVVIRASQTERPRWEPRLRRATVSRRRVAEFLTEYQRAVGAAAGTYAPDEDGVGKLFVAALSGNPTARTLFCRMPQDVRLDGAAAEDYGMALRDLWRGTNRVRSDSEPEEGWCRAGFVALSDSP